MNVTEKPAGVNRRACRHRLNRLARPAIRCRLRFLTDRRRRFTGRSRLLNLGQAVLSRGPVNLTESWSKTIPQAGKSWSHVSHHKGNDGGSREKAIRTKRCCRIRADRCRFRPAGFRAYLPEPTGSSSDPKGHRAGGMDFAELPRRNFLGLY